MEAEIDAYFFSSPKGITSKEVDSPLENFEAKVSKDELSKILAGTYIKLALLFVE